MSEVVSTATLFADDLRTNPGLLPYLVGYGYQFLALVHTTTEHSRDWCIGLLTFFCQKSYAQTVSNPVSRCSRLLKTTELSQSGSVKETSALALLFLAFPYQRVISFPPLLIYAPLLDKTG